MSTCPKCGGTIPFTVPQGMKCYECQDEEIKKLAREFKKELTEQWPEVTTGSVASRENREEMQKPSETPETDERVNCPLYRHHNVVSADFARKLERERDEAVKRGDEYGHKYAKTMLERNQLRKVCDELAEKYRQEMVMVYGHAKDCYCDRCVAFYHYNQLPHVKAKGMM